MRVLPEGQAFFPVRSIPLPYHLRHGGRQSGHEDIADGLLNDIAGRPGGRAGRGDRGSTLHSASLGSTPVQRGLHCVKVDMQTMPNKVMIAAQDRAKYRQSPCINSTSPASPSQTALSFVFIWINAIKVPCLVPILHTNTLVTLCPRFTINQNARALVLGIQAFM